MNTTFGVLTPEQQAPFDDVMNYVYNKELGAFFIDGFAGTEKALLYHAILVALRKNE